MGAVESSRERCPNGVNDMANRKKWFDDKLELVRDNASRGLTARAIFELNLPELSEFTERAIQNVMACHGFTDPVRSARRKRAKRLSPEKKAALLKYLRSPGARMSNIGVARKLKVQTSSVEYFRKKLGQRVDRQRIFRSKQYRKECSKRVLRFGREQRQGLLEMLEKKRERLLKSRCLTPTKRCKVCKRMWFALPYFFYTSTYHTKLGKKRCFFGTCKGCYNEAAAARLKRR